MTHRLTLIAPRLCKLLLMLSSPHDGEVVAAARAIAAALNNAGHDWHDLVKGLNLSVVQSDIRSDLHDDLDDCAEDTDWFDDVDDTAENMDSVDDLDDCADNMEQSHEL